MGSILPTAMPDYSSMTHIGCVKICMKNARLYIDLNGFEFSDTCSAEEQIARIMAWLGGTTGAHARGSNWINVRLVTKQARQATEYSTDAQTLG
jgi:hypothetical protein